MAASMRVTEMGGDRAFLLDRRCGIAAFAILHVIVHAEQDSE
jgi:hypothetical protein